MILRAFRKQSAPKSTRSLYQDIRKLALFGSLPDHMLKTIATTSEKLALPAGEWNPPQDDEFQYFLFEGELTLSTQGQQGVRLDHNTPGTRYPLPKENWRIRMQTPATLIRIPGRYLGLIQTPGHQPGTGIELHEDDDEAQLYLDLHRKLRDGQYNLPVLPDLAVRISKAIDDPNTDNETIARLIQLDPALSARLMGVVNSAAFAGSVPTRSLPQAVSRLGRHRVHNLVLSCIVRDLFHTDSRPLRKHMQELWTHSCRVAAISSVLARNTPGLDPDQALLAGLIHDIGAIPLLHAAQSFPGLLDSPDLLTRLVEGMKAEVGQLTLQSWHFDAELCQLAYHAEDWHRLGTAMADPIDVVLVSQLHAFVGQGFTGGYPAIDRIPAFDRLALGQLTPRHSIAVLDQAESEIDEIERLLN